MGDEPEHSFEEEAKREADSFKDKGNECVKKKDFTNAIKYYKLAIEIYHREHTYHGNLALCYLRQERYAECVAACTEAIQLDSKFAKAFFRRSQAYDALGDTAKAIDDIKKVIQFEPSVHSHRRDLERLQLRLANENMERGKNVTCNYFS